MIFNFDCLSQIINTVEGLLYMSDPHSLVNIYTGYNTNINCDINPNILFVKLALSLKNGKLEILLDDRFYFLIYTDNEGENTKWFSGDYRDVSLLTSSFQRALKQILIFDQQQVNKSKITNIFDESEVSKDKSCLSNSSLDEIRKIITEGT